MVASSVAAQASVKGVWLSPFDHSGTAKTCNQQTWPTGNVWALHMSLIPKGPKQGWVIVWDNAFPVGAPTGVVSVHRWALVNPVTKVCENYCLPLPIGVGDLFCAGHSWTAKGNLLVAGGTWCHGTGVGQTCTRDVYEGSPICYVWEPPGAGVPAGGLWTRVADLDEPRWYPSVVALGTEPISDEDRMMVVGGTHVTADVNSYQVWRPTSVVGSWQVRSSTSNKPNTFAGPTTGNHQLGDYTRAHLMSALNDPNLTGRVMTAGFKPGTSRVDHYATPGVWPVEWQQQNWPNWRAYGTSVVLPISPGGVIKDFVMAIGGKGNSILSTAEVTNGGMTAAGAWTPVASLAQQRWLLNAVLLPDSRVFVVGGERTYQTQGCSDTPALIPELYDPVMNIWVPMEMHSIVRDYHSTALLLPDATVLSAGGDSHLNAPANGSCPDRGPPITTPSDYQVWQPYYLHSANPRPVIATTVPAGSSLTWTRGQSYTVTYQALSYPASISRACLVRAGSVTHHSDTNQRVVELEVAHVLNTDPPTPGYQPAVTLSIPSNASGLLPRGYYMLYLLSNQGVPSAAIWVKVV